MFAMRVMKPPIHQVISVVAMRNGFMPAARTMNMLGVVVRMAKVGRTTIRVLRTHFDDMLFDHGAALVMQMAVVKVVDVIAVLDRNMAAGRSVFVRMVGMCPVTVGRHLICLSLPRA
jgi:hypothetical protein